MRWTDEQDRIMRELASRGAEAVAKAIKAKTGVSRSVEAVKMHASREGVSLLPHETCPGCGTTVRKLHRDTGLCPVCNKKLKARAKRQEYREKRAEIERAANYRATPEYAAANREYNAARRQVQRGNRRED